ncbi:TonB-dependent receptor [Polaribacter batillariae]|uniref:TonB-dependent receptor n=1 Tax=Polaribacter batillariae TaxID=2808900 RepID=A0ABX7ST37_9FLAO|nr:TonB-dependent receptor [Polaribacter batillariae]QTD37404.1 TonB-dependent receptor [Polaribacter batillariae]
MKKTFYLILLFLPLSFLAQTTLKGKVVDDSKYPLPGASIIVKGTTKGEITDFDGNFTITISKTPVTLVVSYLGYKTKEVLIDKQTNITIELKADTQQLEEIVVIGYGSVNKKDLTGSVASVKVNEVTAQQNTTVDQILQGRAAGVQVTQNAGSPGSGVSVKIRGVNSLRGNNEPLYVIDGVIIASAGEDAGNAGDSNSLQENQSGLNGINPRDIENIEVLKDASATAIYGSRGANGVIIITTKKGKKGKISISSYLTTAASSIDRKIDMLSGLEFAKYQNDVNAVNSQNPDYQITNGEVFRINADGSVNTIASRQANWQDEFYKIGFSQSAGASFSGGSEKGNYFVSVGYNNQGGIVENSKFQTGNFNVNIAQDLSDKLKLNAKFSAFLGGGNFAQDGDRAGGGNRSFVNNILTFRPLEDEDGGIVNPDDAFGPSTWINDFEDVSEESRFIAMMALTYKFDVKGLSFKFQAGGNKREKERRRYYGISTFIGGQGNGVFTSTKLDTKSYQVNNLLTYNNTFNKEHRINAVAGITYDVRERKNTLYAISDFSTNIFGSDLPNYGQAVTRPLTVEPSKTQLLSYLTRLNYTFKNRYVLTGTFRLDGSSKFSKKNRFSAFPSFSLAWRATNENFLKNSKVINNLKIRAGWGRTGNQAIEPYQTFGNYTNVLYGTTGNTTAIGFVPANIGNSDLIWETTEQVNFGIDFGLFDSKITGNIDAYRKQTDDLLQLAAIPVSSAFSNLLINRGSIQTKGIEFSLNANLVDKDDFTIDLGGNIAYSRNKILNLGLPTSDVYINGNLEQRSFYLGDPISSGTFFRVPANIFIEGEQIGLFYGYETDGIYQSGDPINVSNTVAGDVRIIDQNNDGEINADDRTVIGNPNPDFIFGGYLDMKYKGFSLNVLMNGVYGNDIVNGTNVRIGYANGQTHNIIRKAYTEAWSPTNPSTTYPRVGYNKENQALAINDRQVEDGSFLRISNITLGYDIPVEKSKLFSRANIFVSGSNLFTFTNYSGYNPEITSFLYNGNIIGTDWNGAPNAKTITLGLNLNF